MFDREQYNKRFLKICQQVFYEKNWQTKREKIRKRGNGKVGRGAGFLTCEGQITGWKPAPQLDWNILRSVRLKSLNKGRY